jgi:hypothetical protein
MHSHTECSTPAERLAAQFSELPGLRLTPQQTARLLDIDCILSEHVVHMLIDAAFLRRMPDGSLIRAEQ